MSINVACSAAGPITKSKKGEHSVTCFTFPIEEQLKKIG